MTPSCTPSLSIAEVEGSSGSWTLTIGGPPPVAGCTDDTAENFNVEATMDDGSCTWNGGCSSASYTACDSGDQCVYVSWWCDGSSEFGNAGWGPDCADGSDENFDSCCAAGDYDYDSCNPTYDVDVSYAFSQDIAGFQFNVNCVEIVIASGCSAAYNFDLVYANA